MKSFKTWLKEDADDILGVYPPQYIGAYPPGYFNPSNIFINLSQKSKTKKKKLKKDKK